MFSCLKRSNYTLLCWGTQCWAVIAGSISDIQALCPTKLPFHSTFRRIYLGNWTLIAIIVALFPRVRCEDRYLTYVCRINRNTASLKKKTKQKKQKHEGGLVIATSMHADTSTHTTSYNMNTNTHIRAHTHTHTLLHMTSMPDFGRPRSKTVAAKRVRKYLRADRKYPPKSLSCLIKPWQKTQRVRRMQCM